MKKTAHILVTGGTGLVGAHLLVQLIAQGNKVRALHRKTADLNKVKHIFSYYFDDFNTEFNKIEWVLGDIIDVPSLEPVFKDITQIYHCAAVVSFKRKDEELMRKVNIEGTANMVNLSLVNKVEKFCYISSIATLDKKENNSLIDETCEWNPENNNYDYAISKYGGEMEVWRASQEGLDTIIVHPGVILGSGFWDKNTGKFFTNAADNFNYYTTGITGFVGVKDVVKAVIQLMESTIVDDNFVLVSENKSFQEIMTSMAVNLGTKPPRKKVTPLIASIAWRIAWLQAKLTGKEAFITKHSAKSAQKIHKYSSDKIQETLHFKFESIDTVIKDSCIDFLKDMK